MTEIMKNRYVKYFDLKCELNKIMLNLAIFYLSYKTNVII